MTQWLPHINSNTCIGCADCVNTCPTHALEQVNGKSALTRPDACTYCAACEDICPVGAIELPYLVYIPKRNEHHD